MVVVAVKHGVRIELRPVESGWCGRADCRTAFGPGWESRYGGVLLCDAHAREAGYVPAAVAHPDLPAEAVR
jgi:hypothetical protein